MDDNPDCNGNGSNGSSGNGTKANGFKTYDRKKFILSKKRCNVEGCKCDDLKSLNAHHILFKSHNSNGAWPLEVPKEILRKVHLNAEIVCNRHESEAHKKSWYQDARSAPITRSYQFSGKEDG